jgi:hypothetical protein
VAEHYEHTPAPADTEFVTAMANLATATSADHETIATLKRAIATLTDQLKDKDIWAKSQEAEVRRLLGVQGNTRPAAAASTPTIYVRKSYRTNNDNYCWSHGYQVGLNHTSANCTKKSRATRITQAKLTSWAATLGAVNFSDKMGKFR